MYLTDTSRYDVMVRLAAEIMDEYGVNGFPLDAMALLAKMRIPVKTYDQLNADDATAVAEKVLKDAFTARIREGGTTRYVIYYNRMVRKERRKTSLLHELGHVILDHPSDEEPYESEAKFFSAYLQIPVPILIAGGFDSCRPAEVASIFGTSREVAVCSLDRARARINHKRRWYDYEQLILDSCAYWLSENGRADASLVEGRLFR